MSIPLKALEDYQGNIYQITCAAIKEAEILSEPGCGGKEIEEKNEKIVSVVLTKALNGEISYTPSNQQ
ncbi:MAG: hypothetical protein WCQ66_05355 [Sphaerochaetaceae bacterium]